MSIFPTPARGTWVPSFNSTGGMTVSGMTVESSSFAVNGALCFFDFRANGTLGGVASAVIQLTPPLALPAFVSGFNTVFVATILTGGAPRVGRGFPRYDLNLLQINCTNGVADVVYTLGAFSVIGQGFYWLG